MIAETASHAERVTTTQTLPRREKAGTRTGLLIPILIACLTVVTAAGFLFNWKTENTALTFPTPYQALLLSNGAVYYGKLHGYGTPHPVMTNVYYIVSRRDPKTNQVSNILVKLGHELHEPDRMYLTPRSIVYVETVGAHSKVAQLIAESGGS